VTPSKFAESVVTPTLGTFPLPVSPMLGQLSVVSATHTAPTVPPNLRTVPQAVHNVMSNVVGYIQVRASPGIWLGQRGHADFNSLWNDPSMYIFCRFLLKLLTLFVITVSSGKKFHLFITLSVKKCCRRSV